MTNKTFLGNEISQYGIDNNRVDLEALAASFQHIYCSNSSIFEAYDDWEVINGEDYSYYEGNICYSSEGRSKRLEELLKEINDLNDRKNTYSKMLEESCSQHRIKRFEMLIRAVDDRISKCEKIISELEIPIYNEVLYWYIIDFQGAKILSMYTEEIVFYNYELDMYLWGVTHFVTDWEYALTEIRIDTL